MALGAVGLPAAAQVAGRAVSCAGQRISEIEVQTRPPYYPRNGKWWTTPLGILSSIHTNTKPDVVQRFILLQPGMPCDPTDVAESERILRAQPFIAQAHISTYDDGAGGVILLAETTDEFTPILALGTTGHSPYLRSFRVGEGNFLGGGRSLQVEWADGQFRDTYGVRYADYQFVGHPWHFNLALERFDLGQSNLLMDVSHPFITDRQRIAWRVIGEDRSDVFGFDRSDLEAVPVGLDRKFADVGGVVRIGGGRRLSLLGFSISHEADNVGLPPDPDSLVNFDSLVARYHARRNTRINILWGLRNLSFLPVQHFDALEATQDVRTGFQLGTLLGRGVRVLDGHDDDLFLASDAYVGYGTAQTFGYLTATAEGRQDYRTRGWDGILASARLMMYHRLTTDHTLVGTVDWGSGWNQRVPFQLSLGEADGGVRGYLDSQDAGAMRGVVRLEDRWVIGRVRDQAAVGLAFFADAGRVWAGDAPFSITTPVKTGVGVGILGAFPPGSQQTWRLDLALPVNHDAHAKWEVRLSVLNASHLFTREPRDIRFSRELVSPSSVFTWP
ncbi:MAG TPA: hypothetical protein VF102_11575 [Gemmatimonadaceae bacterium]